MTIYYAVPGDNGTALDAELVGAGDLTGASVEARVLPLGAPDAATPVAIILADVIDPTSSAVRAVIEEGLGLAGDYALRWYVVYPDSYTRLTWPNEGADYLRVR